MCVGVPVEVSIHFCVSEKVFESGERVTTLNLKMDRLGFCCFDERGRER